MRARPRQRLALASKADHSCCPSLIALPHQSDEPGKLPAAQRSVKVDHRNPQSHINLALALLGTGGKGVRRHIELVQKVMDFSEEVRTEVNENIEDGLKRKPDWKELQKVKKWLAE